MNEPPQRQQKSGMFVSLRALTPQARVVAVLMYLLTLCVLLLLITGSVALIVKIIREAL